MDEAVVIHWQAVDLDAVEAAIRVRVVRELVALSRRPATGGPDHDSYARAPIRPVTDAISSLPGPFTAASKGVF